MATRVFRFGGAAAHRTHFPLATAEADCSRRVPGVSALDASGRDYRICYVSDASMRQVAALHADLAVAALPRALTNNYLVEVPLEIVLPALPLTSVCIRDDGGELAKATISFVQAGGHA